MEKPSSSRTVYSGRFIPSRAASNFSLFSLPRSPGAGRPYSALLRQVLFGPENQKNIFRFKSDAPRGLLCPLPDDDLPTSAPRRSPTPSRKIATSPYKVLDAPNIVSNFYYNVLDWSSLDTLAVGLGSNVYLWFAPTNSATKLCSLGHGVNVCSVGWEPCGEHLAVGSRSGEVQIWDVSRCQMIRTMRGHDGHVTALAWGCSALSSGGSEGRILHRDVRARDDFVAHLLGHEFPVCGLRWSHNGRELASGGGDGRLLVWNRSSTKPVVRLSGHNSSIKAIAWSPHRSGLLASGGGVNDRRIRFWNTNTGSGVGCVDTGSQVCNLSWSRSVDELVSSHGYANCQVVVWRYPSMSKLATLTGHTDRVLFMAVSPDGQNIVTGSADETLRFWNVFPLLKPEKITREIGANSLGRSQIR